MSGELQNETNDPYFGLEAGPVHYGTISDRKFQERLTWTKQQKALFLDLLGRRSRSELVSIASSVGKSVVECQAYLDMLDQGASVESPVPEAEIPFAFEIPEDRMEEEVLSPPDEGDFAVEFNKDELIDLKKLVALTGTKLTQDTLDKLTGLVKERTRGILVLASRIGPTKRAMEQALDQYFQVFYYDPPDVFAGANDDLAKDMGPTMGEHSPEPDSGGSLGETSPASSYSDAEYASDDSDNDSPTHQDRHDISASSIYINSDAFRADTLSPDHT